MAKPEISPTLSGYTFFWADGQITIEVSRVHTHSDGRVTGEIFIRNGNKALRRPSNLNFTAERTGDILVKNLMQLYPGKADWQKIIDELCYHLLLTTRQGEPVIELNTVGDVTQPEYIIFPLIVKNYPNVIFGDPGSAKSTLAVILSQVIMLPWHDNHMGLIAPTEGLKVLYLDWETDSETIRWQTTMLQRGIKGAEILFLNYRKCSQPLLQDIEQIKIHIASTGAGLIVIDSLGLAAGGELKDTQSPLSFYSALRTLKTTSLILAHNSKDRDSKTRSIYGNQFFTAQARNVWELRKDQDADSNELNIALFHRKPPPFSKMHKPLGFKLLYDNEAGIMRIEHSDPKTIGEFLEQMGWKSRIIEALKRQPLTNTELCKALNTNSANISTNLSRMEKRNIVSKVDNKWGLIEREFKN